MPLRSGTVRLHSDRKWRQATVLTGDIRNGQWRTCESAQADKSDDGLVLNVSPDQTLSLLLVTEAPKATKWCRAIDRAVTDPASLP
jgi:hypothetical protein